MSEIGMPCYRDQMWAGGIELASRIGVGWPAFGHWMAGDHPRIWYATATLARELTGWHETPGNPKSGWRPKTYAGRTLLQTDIGKLYQKAERHGGVPAAAFAVGEVVMAAELPPEEALPEPHRDREDKIVVSFGVGRHMLRSTIGIYMPGSDTVISAPGAVEVLAMNVIAPNVPALYPDAVLM